MTKLEVILQSPDALAGSFASKPKVIYLAGTRYCRIEEAAAPERRIHALMIINEPDYWMVNPLVKTARHGVDPGPTLNCRLPMFSDSTAKSTGDSSIEADLEFGLEFEYFNSKGATYRNLVQFCRTSKLMSTGYKQEAQIWRSSRTEHQNVH